MNSCHPFRSVAAERRYLDRYNSRSHIWPTPSQEVLVETSFGQTFVRKNGPDGAPPVILLPGIGATSLMWAYNVDGLARKYSVYSVDNIYDYGRSVNTKPMHNAEDFSQWLDSLIINLGLNSKINLVGASYGGWIAAQYALEFPHRVNCLSLIAPAGTILPLSFGFIWHAILCGIPHRIFFKYLMYWLASDLVSRDPSSRQIVEEMIDDGFIASRTFVHRQMIPPTVLSDDDWRSLKMPVLVLIGEHEKIFSAPSALSKLKSIAPHIHAELINKAGHDLFIVQAEQVNRYLEEFINESSRL